MARHEITSFGAVGDGESLNTEAIQRAVDACVEAGGGKVVVPAGTFLSGSIHLRSNIEFHLEAGAVLKSTPDLAAFPDMDVLTHGYHINNFGQGLLSGFELENVAITGRGILDGSGKFWWDRIDAGELDRRPPLIYLIDCERVLIDGVRLQNSATWSLQPLICRELTIRGISIHNPWKPYHNCDGIDLVSCNGVTVSHCQIDTGDDGICMKSLPDFHMSAQDRIKQGLSPVDYDKPAIPCENVAIDNCIVRHAHSGVGIWCEVIGGLRNVSVSNCIFEGTRSGVRFARYPYPGGYVRDIRVDNVVMRRVGYVFEISNWCPEDQRMEGPGRDSSPEFSNIHFSNITATQAQIACEAHGLEACNPHNISFSNIDIDADMGFDFRNVKDVLLDRVTLTCRGTPLRLKDTENVEIHRLAVKNPTAALVQIENTRTTWVRDCSLSTGQETLVGLVGDSNSQFVCSGNRISENGCEIKNVLPGNAWNITSHAYTGARWIRDTGSENPWLPVSSEVMSALENFWSREQIDAIYSISRVEPNSRNGAEVQDPGERRRIYMIEAEGVDERLVLFEDGELLQRISDPDFHAHTWEMI